jgi:RNA polymerase sigma-70 factor, ECF subfamily
MRASIVSGCGTVPTDEELLEKHAAGDGAALGELFRRYRFLAYRVAYRHLGQEADALDAVQEGFVKAIKHVEGLRRRELFKAWLLRVVANAAIDLRRKRGHWQTAGLDPSWLHDHNREREQPAASTEALRNLEGAELRRSLDQALALLPEAHRQTFILHADAGLAYKEVAEVLGVPIGTVMSRLFYARRKLQKVLFPVTDPLTMTNSIAS